MVVTVHDSVDYGFQNLFLNIAFILEISCNPDPKAKIKIK